MSLTRKQRVFVEEYLKCWNGAEAARRAGYKYPRRSAYENLTHPDIAARVQERIEAKAMAANEILAHLADIARFDIGSIMGKAGVIDLEKAKEQEFTQFLHKLKWTDKGIEVEAYDKMDALELLGKHMAMWVERHEIGTDGEIVVKFVSNIDDDKL